MVNTFLPHADFIKSAQSLDNKRLGKQRVEAWQILQALLGKTKGWVNHPATIMWRGHEKSLCEYGIAICDEWISRGYKDSMRERFIAIHPTLPDCELPDWFGEPEFHNSHKSNLKRKDPSYYNFDVDDSKPYLWYIATWKKERLINDTETYKYSILQFRIGASSKYKLTIFKTKVVQP